MGLTEDNRAGPPFFRGLRPPLPGVTVTNNGGVDFCGGTIVWTPDVGACESR